MEGNPIRPGDIIVCVGEAKHIFLVLDPIPATELPVYQVWNLYTYQKHYMPMWLEYELLASLS